MKMAEERPAIVDVLRLVLDRAFRSRRELDITIEFRAGERTVASFNVKGHIITRPVK